MPKTEEQENLQFVITLVNIKMKVKFPCKMVIEQSGCVLTKQTQPSQGGKFVFNQELRLKEDSEKLFSELSVCLITDKGARYTAGSIRLYHNEVLNSEGERLVVTLSKCLDPEALCEIRIDKVVKRGTQRKRTLTSIPEHQKTNSPRLNEEDTMSPRDYKTNKIDHLPINESKSESYLPSSSNNIAQRKGQLQNKPKDYLPLPINTPTTKRFGNPSPKARRETMYSKSKYQPFQSQAELQRQKAIESDVYKDNYLKLKQKYQREAEHSKNELSRRMMLENNENNFKLEVMRYKIKNDELEKSLAERTAKVKELTAALSAYQGKESEISYLREDLSARQHTMRMLEETIVALTRENDELRIANKETTYKFQQKIVHLEGDIDTLTSRFTAKQQELEKEVKIFTETLAFKESELARKNEQLEKENKNINDLQKALQSKLFECDSLLQAERNNSKQRADQSKAKLQQCDQVIQKLTQEKNDTEGEKEKLKAIILKNQYQIRLYQQETINLKSQLEELKTIRDKYTELSKEMKIITEQKLVLSKNHQRIMLSKENSIEEIAAQYKKEVQYQKRTAKDLEEKNKVVTSKLIETEGQLELTKGSLEKMKKSHQTLNKDYAELKEKEKAIKRSLKSKEEQCQDAKKEIQRIKEKHQSITDSIKAENSKQREQIIRLKKQLQHEASKNDDLAASNSDLTMQMARIKITLQLSQEKCEKLTTSAHQRYAQFEKIIKQHEGVIDLLQEKIKNQKGSQKEYFAKIQKTDQEIFMISERNEKASKELRTLQERNKQLETNFKSKQSQLTESLRKINDLELKNNTLQEKQAKLKEGLQSSKNELEKSQKIIDILQRDYQRAKADILNYSLKLGQKQKQIDQQAQLIRKERQSMANLENKLSSVKKELEKFKESVAEALNSSFVQATSSFTAQKNESYKTLSSIQRVNSKVSALRGNADFNNELALANLISQAGKQSTGQISKLNDRVKQLERELQTTKTELERTLQASKRQKQQAAHTIKQLEDELILLRDEKGEAEGQLQSQIYELQSQIRHLSKECEELQENKTELQDTLYSLKAELQSTNQELVKRIRQHKKECNEYVERMEEQSHHYQIAEKKIHDLQAKVKEAESSLVMEKAFSSKQEQHGLQLEEEKQKWANEAEGLKKQVKSLEEKYYQLQIQFLTTNEIKQKYQSMLCEEESKLKDVRFFNSNILKEKEEIIRKELSLNVEITNLENSVADLQHKLQQEEGSKNKYKADYEETKEQARKLSQQIKELQGVIACQKQKYNQIRDRIRQKQAILNETKEETMSLQKRIEESNVKSKYLIEQLRQQNDMLSRQLDTITIQSNETTRTLEGKLAKANQQLQTAKEEMGELEESIFVERENNHAMVESINKLKAELEEYKSKMEETELNYKQVLEENKQKDEYMFEMGGKIYELENRLKEADEEKQREIEELNTSLNVKYDEDYQQLYQKIEFIEKERQYFKQKCQEKDEIIAKKNEELRQKSAQEAQIRKSHDIKVKRLEDEKIAIFSDKNKEIAKFVDENKVQFQAIRAKQAQIRKVVHQLQISRTTIQKLQSKIKDMQSEKSNQLKSLQNQMENLRRKELTFKSYKDLVRTNQWNCERQVRKIIQNFIKKMLQLSDKQARNDNLISLIKGVEEGLLTMISAISKE